MGACSSQSKVWLLTQTKLDFIVTCCYPVVTLSCNASWRVPVCLEGVQMSPVRF